MTALSMALDPVLPCVRSTCCSCPNLELVRSDSQVGLRMSGLVHRPCYAQHPQNCFHEARSRLWVRTHMHSGACSKCEPVFQSESASGASTALTAVPMVRFTCFKHSKFPIGSFLRDLPAPNLKFGTCTTLAVAGSPNVGTS